MLKFYKTYQALECAPKPLNYLNLPIWGIIFQHLVVLDKLGMYNFSTGLVFFARSPFHKI